MKMKIFGIALLIICSSLFSGFIGYRESRIMQDKTAPLLALKYMVNLKKLEAGECKQNYWSMYSEIDISIGRYAASYEEISILSMLPSYSFLNETYAIKELLDFRISHLQKQEQITEFEKNKLESFVKLAEFVNR